MQKSCCFSLGNGAEIWNQNGATMVEPYLLHNWLVSQCGIFLGSDWSPKNCSMLNIEHIYHSEESPAVALHYSTTPLDSFFFKSFFGKVSGEKIPLQGFEHN